MRGVLWLVQELTASQKDCAPWNQLILFAIMSYIYAVFKAMILVFILLTSDLQNEAVRSK